MELLGSWLKQVILVVILATFADMLLPSQSFRKYARTVLSLFVLLVLLSPLVKLFQGEWDEKRLTGSVESLAAGGGTSGTMVAAMPSLESIYAEAERVKRTQEQRTTELVEARIAGMVREQVAASMPEMAADVRVSVGLTRSGEPEVRRIEVEVAARQAGGAASAQTSRQGGMNLQPVRVEAVAPVAQGQTEAKPVTAQAAAAPAGAPEAGRSSAEPGLARLQREIAGAWELPADRVEVRHG